MKTDFVKELYDQLKEDVDLFTDLGDLPVKRLNGKINLVRESIAKLRAELEQEPFENQEEEIEFFKYWKPRFVCEQILAFELFTIETSRPLADELLLKSFYEQELKVIKRFFEQYRFMYQYYQLEASDLDHLLFVRNAHPSAILLPETQVEPPTFSTAADYLFAKFIAFEKLQDYLVSKLYQPYDNSGQEPGLNKTGLKWTGDSINLVELAYGIWLTGQVNNGNASITEIVLWLEKHLQVNIGRAHRRWTEIAQRKSLSSTRYIDQVKDAINKRLDDENSLKKHK